VVACQYGNFTVAIGSLTRSLPIPSRCRRAGELYSGTEGGVRMVSAKGARTGRRNLYRRGDRGCDYCAYTDCVHCDKLWMAYDICDHRRSRSRMGGSLALVLSSTAGNSADK